MHPTFELFKDKLQKSLSSMFSFGLIISNLDNTHILIRSEFSNIEDVTVEFIESGHNATIRFPGIKIYKPAECYFLAFGSSFENQNLLIRNIIKYFVNNVLEIQLPLNS